MGTSFSSAQQAAISKFTGVQKLDASSEQSVFDTLSSINWREVDFTLSNETRITIDSLIAHSAETQSIPRLFGFVAKQLDVISSSSLYSSSSSSSSSHQKKEGSASPNNNNNNNINQNNNNNSTNNSPNNSNNTKNLSKDQTLHMTKTCNVTRLASILLFNIIQQCAGNPFVLLRLTNSNEEAMTMLGAAAEFVVRVPFSPISATLHVETSELLRFSFSTRLYGTGIGDCDEDNNHEDEIVKTGSFSSSSSSSATAASAATAAGSGTGTSGQNESQQQQQQQQQRQQDGTSSQHSRTLSTSSNSNNNNNKNNNSDESAESIVRDPFLRRLALGQRGDALLTKALVHALLQRICTWASVLRGKIRPAVWVAHQKASNVSVFPQPSPPPTSTSFSSSSSSSSHSSTTSAPSSNQKNPSNNNTNNQLSQQQQQQQQQAGFGSKMYGWFFGSSSSSPAVQQASAQHPSTAHTSASHDYPTAGTESAKTSAEVLVGSCSLHLLLSLLFFERGQRNGKKNTAVDVIHQLKGIDVSGNSGFAGGLESSSSNSASSSHQHSSSLPPPTTTSSSYQISPILGGEWPLEIIEALATLVPSHVEAIMLLYSLLYDCPNFSRSIAASDNHSLHVQITHLAVDLMRAPTERPSSPESLFVAVVIAMLARIDCVAKTIFTQRLRSIPAFFTKSEQLLQQQYQQQQHPSSSRTAVSSSSSSTYIPSSSLTVGGFLVLALVKIVFRASMGDGQATIGSAWLSALTNLSPFVVGLDTVVEQKLASLFIALLRRVSRLRAEVKANENAFAAAAQLDVAYAHLDILGTALFQMVADPQRNPTLLYELLYHRDKLSTVTATWIEGDAVWRALKPITFILDKIQAELYSTSSTQSGGSGSGHRSIEQILDLIRSLGRISIVETPISATAAGEQQVEESRVRIQLVPRQGIFHLHEEEEEQKHHQHGGEKKNHHHHHHHHHHQEQDAQQEQEEEEQEELLYPKITIIGSDEEIILASYDFNEDSAFSSFSASFSHHHHHQKSSSSVVSSTTGSSDDDDEDGSEGRNRRRGSGGGRRSNCEAFFAVILWNSTLHTDARLEAPGCLRHSCLGISHQEVYPIFKKRK